MSENLRLDHKIGFQNTFYTKCINVIIDSIGPSIILRSIFKIPVKPPISQNFNCLLIFLFAKYKKTYIQMNFYKKISF